MKKQKDAAKQPETSAHPAAKLIDGELTMKDLRDVVGAGALTPIVNGKYYRQGYKSRFGIDN
jgi:hypothetical protein